ncbi:unnamed protein product [Schistosoma intercalatum]|nr:unnamed protein product [Schistosoma intercalatum]CAH8646801.1 unnamed protein product [Schistosoma intercalatum]
MSATSDSVLFFSYYNKLIVILSTLATVIVHQPTVTTTVYHRYPVGITCPFCHNSGVTRVRLESGCLPWLLCGILCFFGFFFGCCLIPFCLDSTKSARHFCPSCNRQVGYYSPL